MKVSVIGGGSSYTPELIMGFVQRQDQFPLEELWLMDIDEKRLDIVGKFAQRMASAQNARFSIYLTNDLSKAITGAKYVITQFRVGMMQARKNDEYLGKRHGLIGQETTGVGGMAKALRTIPQILKVADTIRNTSPGALLVNFTNPSGLITQALSKYAPDIQTAGVCNGPFWGKMEIVENLNKYQGTNIDANLAQLDVLGLNHLSWFRGLKYQCKDFWPEVMKTYLTYQPDLRWDHHTLKALNMIPNGYFEYYYYTDRKMRLQEKWPPSRAEQVMKVEKQLLSQYDDPAINMPPDDLMKRGGAYYSTVATQLLNAHYNNLGETHVVNVCHNGAVRGYPEDWVLEMPCKVDAVGIHPVQTAPLPHVCFGLLSSVKSYEILTVEAAVHSDYQAAYQALLAHPLGPDADKIREVLDDMLDTNREFLSGFLKVKNE